MGGVEHVDAGIEVLVDNASIQRDIRFPLAGIGADQIVGVAFLRIEPTYDLAGLLATGLLLRFAASFFRFSKATDSSVYHGVGSTLAASFRHFDFAVDLRGTVPGTGGMNLVAGFAEVLTNANKFAIGISATAR